jgi:hypothetical protein
VAASSYSRREARSWHRCARSVGKATTYRENHLALSTTSVVNTLDEMGMLDLDGESPWPGKPDPAEVDTYVVSWGEADARVREDGQASTAPVDGWERAVVTLNEPCHPENLGDFEDANEFHR